MQIDIAAPRGSARIRCSCARCHAVKTQRAPLDTQAQARVEATVAAYQAYYGQHGAAPRRLLTRLRPRKFARRAPLPLDVDSLLMEALWKARVSGAVLSKGYVRLRVTCAAKDEMRRVAEGQRGNYQDAGAFVDVDDQWGLGDDRAIDPVSLVDERRAPESLPEAARLLVWETLIVGMTQDELALALRAKRPIIVEVMTQLRTKPSSVVRVPGTVDRHDELRKAARRFVARALEEAPNCSALAQTIDVAHQQRRSVAPPSAPGVMLVGPGRRLDPRGEPVDADCNSAHENAGVGPS